VGVRLRPVAAPKVEHQVMPPQFPAIRPHGRSLPASQRPHAGEQFFKGERLHQIVVRSTVEARDAVLYLAARRKKEDAHRQAATAHGSAQRGTVAPGEHPIDHEDIVGTSKGVIGALVTVVADIHVHALGAEHPRDEARQFAVIFYE
jgi:hypothetical protein